MNSYIHIAFTIHISKPLVYFRSDSDHGSVALSAVNVELSSTEVALVSVSLLAPAEPIKLICVLFLLTMVSSSNTATSSSKNSVSSSNTNGDGAGVSDGNGGVVLVSLVGL